MATTCRAYVGGTVDRILFLTCFGGPEGVWTWADVLDLTALQSDRVRPSALGLT